MSALTEFVLVAVVLFLWESTLWLPLRSIALRRGRGGKKWKTLDPRDWFAVRETGLIPMFPLPPDTGLAPCQVPPLMVDAHGSFLIEAGGDALVGIPTPAWDDLARDAHHIRAGGARIRISSPRCMELLHRARLRGAAPEAAVRLTWRVALSPGRAGREWRRWKLVSMPLRCYGPVLTLGFFAGLPLVYVYLGSELTVYLALWLWCVMALTASHLWWLARRVYPDAKGPLGMDALLSLLVPFHAMRASEIASVHAMGVTHPIGLILSTGDVENQWLGRFIRRILHPLPGNTEDAMFSSALRPQLEKILSGRAISLEDFDSPPDASRDPGAIRYCPRCHGLYQSHVTTCGDCRGLELRSFA